MDYFYKQCFEQFHMLPSDLDDQDYNEFMNMLNAKSPEQQTTDPMKDFNNFNKT